MASTRLTSTALLTLFCGFLSGCGGSQQSTESPGAGDSEDQYGDTEGDTVQMEGEEEMSADEAALLAQIEDSAAAADVAAEDAETETANEEGGREVVYRVSPDGMKVQVEGAEFVPTVKAVKLGGLWGVELTVEAKSETEAILWAPSGGPLAFGGKVERKGEEDRFGDKREGGTEVKMMPGTPVIFKRTWPAKGQKGLASGDRLELHVGLWGFGPTPETRKPVRRFVVVNMVAGANGAQPLVQPPNQ